MPRRLEAVSVLGILLRHKTHNAARELLLSLAEGKEPSAAEEATDAIGAMGDAATVPRLIALFGRADDRLRRRIAHALGEIGDGRAFDTLVTAVDKDNDMPVRAEAAWALGAFASRSAAAEAILTRATSSRSPEVRANAVAALRRLGLRPAAVDRLTSDPDPSVRHNAQRAPSLDDRPGGDWLYVQLADHDRAPLGDERYRLILPGGLHRLGRTSERGMLYEGHVASGQFHVELNRNPP
jgi:HEAT repeat protein